MSKTFKNLPFDGILGLGKPHLAVSNKASILNVISKVQNKENNNFNNIFIFLCII
jgi:hypothetical protein